MQGPRFFRAPCKIPAPHRIAGRGRAPNWPGGAEQGVILALPLPSISHSGALHFDGAPPGAPHVFNGADPVFYGCDSVFHTICELSAYFKLLRYTGAA